MSDDDASATVFYIVNIGETTLRRRWWYIDDEYPDEGICGPFDTEEGAIEHARRGYSIVRCGGKLVTG